MGDFYVYTSLAGILLSVIIMLRGSWYNKANLFLGTYFCVISFQVLIFSLGYKGDSLFWTVMLMGNSLPFYYLIGPFSYFYIRSVITDSAKLKSLDYLHFSFFLIQMLLMMPHYFSSWEHKLMMAQIFQDGDARQLSLNYSIIPDIYNSFLGTLHLSFYLIWNIVIWMKFKKKAEIKLFNNISFKFTEKWIVLFLSIIGIHILNTIFIAISEILIPSRSQFMTEHASFVKYAGVMLMIIIIGLLSFPEIMYGIPRIKARMVGDDAASLEDTKKTEEDATIDLEIIPETRIIQFADVEEKLRNIIHEPTIYLDKDFTIHKLAIETGVPLHHFRFYFSKNDTSFAIFKNKLKVAYAKSLLINSIYDKFSIEGIGKQAGYTSSSSFFAEFKKETGFTPTEFVKKSNQLA